MAGNPAPLIFRPEALSAAGDPLERLSAALDFEAFRGALGAAPRRGPHHKGGASSFDPVVMFKALVLQALYSLSGEATELRIKDRLSFQRFLGFGPEGAVPIPERTAEANATKSRVRGCMGPVFAQSRTQGLLIRTIDMERASAGQNGPQHEPLRLPRTVFDGGIDPPGISGSGPD